MPRVLMGCDGCPATGPLTAGMGKPNGWFSVDTEGGVPIVKRSAVLCPLCYVHAVQLPVPPPTPAPA